MICRITVGTMCAAGAVLMGAACAPALARGDVARLDTARILAEAASGKEWPTYGGTYDEQRFSPLVGITQGNVGSLGVAWTHEFPTSHGVEATPIVVDGVIYVTGAWSVVAALDAKSGELLWQYDPQVPREQLARGCCDAVNRGVAVYEGRVFVGVYDGRLEALDAKTGKLLWSTVTVDPSKPYTITGAPRVVKGKVLIGNGGAEFGVRGYVSAYDAKSGKLAWRFYTTPNPAKKPEGAASDEIFARTANATWGDSGAWQTQGGGGTVWDSIVYDSVNDSILIGVGNSSPWNSQIRDPKGNGDNLFISSIVALDPQTGRYKWHFQEVPRDQWDYTATQSIVLADLPVGRDGAMQRVVMHAPKNGFFYLLDAKTGKFLSGKPFAPLNWATGLDSSGRPIVNPKARDIPPEGFLIRPGPPGAHNWPPMAFNPKTQLVYIPTERNEQLLLPPGSAPIGKSNWNLGYDMAAGIPMSLPKGALPEVQKGQGGGLLAWDPVRQEARWSIDLGSPANGGVLTTASGLVFQGTKMGVLRAYDAQSGAVLWETNLKRGVTAPAVTYEIDGEQYVAVATGWGSSWGLTHGLFWKEKVTRVPGRLVVLKLGGKEAIPDNTPSPIEATPKAPAFGDEQQVRLGFQLFAQNCMVCHGVMAQSSGVLPDLRWSGITADEGAWHAVVIEGALRPNGMVSFANNLSAEDAEAVRAYVLNQAWMAVANGDASAPALAITLATPASGAEEPANEAQPPTGALSLERVFASPSLSGPTPREVKLSPGGRWITLLRNRPEDRERYDLWGYDRQSGQWTLLVDSSKFESGRELSEAEKMQRERQRIGDLKGIVAYDWSDDSRSILVPLEGDLYLAGLDGKVERLTESAEDELNPALSPKGGYVSFVRDGRLWTAAADGSQPRPVTPAEASDTVHWGEAEFVAQEEMGRMTGFWWSPDDARIAVERFDEAPVGVVTRTAIGSEDTRSYQQRYPAAGTPNAVVQLFVMNPDGSGRVEVDLGADRDIYLARVDWAPDGKTLYVQRQNRSQTRLDMLAADPATGKSRVLFEERAAQRSWINLSDNYRFLKDGSLIWWSERDGYGHLYQYDRGKWRQLTAGEWVVTGLAGVDEGAGRVYFTATRDDVLAEQVYSLDLKAPGEIERLTEPGWSYKAAMDESGKTLVVTRSSPDHPRQTYIADGAGQRIAWIEENRLDASHPYGPYLASHRETKFGTIPAADGTPLHWMMITPPLEPGKRYPVFLDHYGGPGAQVVTRAWKGALPQAIVDKGYIYFRLDNRGSENRGVAFASTLYRAMGSVEVADQLAGARYLKTLPFVDPAKVAIFGWSYGGYMTIKMLQANPGAYAAGIAVAPVTKWELYDTHYTERYLGDPRTEPEVYAKSNALSDTAKISDPLLIIHGLADDNVVFEHSSAIISKLQGEAVPFEMMLYPGFTHRISGPQVSRHLYETIFRFLEREGVTPP